MTHEDITFAAGDVTLGGWIFHPPNTTGPAPTIVMAHGLAAVKEQYLDRYASRFAAAGLRTIVYDHRNFGASDGEPRQDIDPWVQIRDFQHAISYARSRDDVDGDRIGVWGTSFSGGHVLVLGATDPRVRCVVSQVPTISGSEAARRRIPPHLVETVEQAQVADLEAIYAGNPPRRRPLIDDGSGEQPVYAGAAATAFLNRPGSRPPTFVNNVTLQSLARNKSYEPGSYITAISPTPLLMIVTEHDDVAFTDLQLDAYQRAREPKRLALLPGDHFTPYDETFDEAVTHATEWFLTHLTPGGAQ